MAVQPWKRSRGKTYRKAGYKRTNNGTAVIRPARVSRPQIRSANVIRLRRNDFGFPDSMVTKFKYGDSNQLTGSANVMGSQSWRLNSCFDPDVTYAGHQPMWYDQFLGSAYTTAPYKNYRVLSSKMKVIFAYVTAPATVAVNQGPCLVGIVPTTSSSLGASTANALLESDAASTKILQDKSGANNKVTCYATYNPQRDLGLDTGDDTISAAYNANPTQVYYAHVFKIDQGGTSIVQVYTEIEFIVELFQRNEVTQS